MFYKIAFDIKNKSKYFQQFHSNFKIDMSGYFLTVSDEVSFLV